MKAEQDHCGENHDSNIDVGQNPVSYVARHKSSMVDDVIDHTPPIPCPAFQVGTTPPQNGPNQVEAARLSSMRALMLNY